MKKYYRVFVSSAKKLLQEERKKVFDALQHNRMINISMEDFCAPGDMPSIDVTRENLQQADVVILIASFLYGSIINQCKENCKLKKCEKCKDNNGNLCVISYTEYEYRYAQENGIPCFCILDNNYSNLSAFTAGIVNKKEQDELLNEYNKGLQCNKEFINAINEKYRMEYNDELGFEKAINTIIGKISNEWKYKVKGLIVAPTAKEPILAKKFVEEILLPMFKECLLMYGKRAKNYEINEGSIRCVVAFYYSDENSLPKRITIFDLPNKDSMSIKDRDYGVVGEMNKKQTSVIYDFEKQILYYLDRDNVAEKPIDKRVLQTENMHGKEQELGDNQMDSSENCSMLLATPIRNSNKKIIGTLTFDFSTKASKIIRSKLLNRKKEVEAVAISDIFSMCEKFAQAVAPFFDNYIYNDFEFLKEIKKEV